MLVTYKIDGEKTDQLLTYSEILDYIKRNNTENDGIYWRFQRIIAHQRVKPGDKNYKGSAWNLMIE